jgi:uncharacterized membrane protein
MTNIDVQQNGRVNATSTHNVIAVSFDPDNDAYQALTTLKELDVRGRLGIEAAAVVVRGDSGQIVVTDHVGSFESAGARVAGCSGCCSASSAARSAS